MKPSLAPSPRLLGVLASAILLALSPAAVAGSTEELPRGAQATGTTAGTGDGGTGAGAGGGQATAATSDRGEGTATSGREADAGTSGDAGAPTAHHRYRAAREVAGEELGVADILGRSLSIVAQTVVGLVSSAAERTPSLAGVVGGAGETSRSGGATRDGAAAGAATGAALLGPGAPLGQPYPVVAGLFQGPPPPPRAEQAGQPEPSEPLLPRTGVAVLLALVGMVALGSSGAGMLGWVHRRRRVVAG